MNITGEDTRLWVNERQRADGSKWFDYSVGISKKTEDGHYVNTYMKVRFAKSVNIPTDLPNGTKMDYEGFITVDSYTDKEGNEVKRPMAMITKADFYIEGQRPKTVEYSEDQIAGFSAAEEDVPF